MNKALLTRISSHLQEKTNDISQIPVVSGFDAFVDEMVRVVGERQSPESFTPMPTIGEFGNWAQSIAGRSGLREAVMEEVASGGCTLNMGDGLATLGFPLHAFLGAGSPPHPAFESMLSKCESVHTLGMEPGRTVCCEFDDGKLMLSFLSHFASYTADFMKQQMADGQYRQACESAHAICFTTWSLFPYMTDCWRMIQSDVLHGLTHRPHIFVDLADASGRSQADILDMLDALAGFESIGRVTLSLNGTEGNVIARHLSLAPADDSDEQLQRLAGQIRDYAKISEVGIHLVKSATAVTENESITVPGPYCAKPKKSVGAGDRFNAGCVAGMLLDLPIAERLTLGTMSSGFFVRQARSATLQELIGFIEDSAD